MTDNANVAAGYHSVDRAADSFWLRVPTTRVEFNIQLPPGKHYYHRAPLRFDELLEIALSTPGSVVCVLEKTPRGPQPPGKAGDTRERRVVNRRLKVLDKAPENAAILIYSPTGERPTNERERNPT